MQFSTVIGQFTYALLSYVFVCVIGFTGIIVYDFMFLYVPWPYA